MNKLYLPIFFIFVLGPNEINACVCGYYSSFCELVEKNQLVLEVVVLRKYGHLNSEKNFIDLEVTNVIFDPQNKALKRYTLQDYVGSSCEVGIFGKFRMAERFVITLDETEQEKGALFPAFTLNYCGHDVLRINYGQVGGYVLLGDYFANDQFDYSLFRENISSICQFSFSNLSLMFISPNPFVDQIVFENKDTFDINFEILDIDGRFIQRGIVEAGSNAQVTTNNLSRGAYFVRFANEVSQRTEKMIKI